MVRFSSYQVAAFSEGEIAVIAPWSELDGALTPAAVPSAWRRAPTYTVGVLSPLRGERRGSGGSLVLSST